MLVFTMGCCRKNPHLPDGWDSGNSHGRGGGAKTLEIQAGGGSFVLEIQTEGGGGLMLQEIQVRGGVKKRPHPSGGCAFFLE